MDALILTVHAVVLYDPDVISASMGSFFHLPVVRIPDHQMLFSYVDGIRDRYGDLQIVGTTAHSEKSIAQVDFTPPSLLMIGNETEGLNRTFKQYCDVLATIPMGSSSSATSFNVGCAATVFLYEAIRQRLPDTK